MYCLIYKFNVKSNKVNQFKRAWEALTELIYEFEGSYGSRLHIDENGDYIAYAQWPSKNVFEMAGKN
ncbi:MAG: antibiotic biosynthesis monooxygenase, partial [Bacteroidia bacterium]